MTTIIIGNSAAGLAAVKSFRKYNQTDELILISKEGGLAYSRVLLPYVLREKLPYEGLFIREKAFYEENKVTYIEKEVKMVDDVNKAVVLTDETKISFDKLILATGSFAVAPPIEGIKQEGIYHMWTKADVDALLPLFATKKKMAVLGSGFVALQGAWAAKTRGLDVTVIELMDRIMPSVLDVKGATILTEKIKETGVVLKTGTVTERFEKLEDGTFKIVLKDQEPVYADFIVVGTGVRCNIGMLEGSGIACDRAVLVNENMETNVAGIYAAGDVAAGPTTFGDVHKVHVLWPTAVEMGEIAGANAAGKKLEYRGSLNMNVTQMYDATVASMGLFNENDIDGSREMPVGEGYLKVCYKDEKVVGVCLVGDSESVSLFGKLRPIIRKGEVIDCEPEKLEQYVNRKAFQTAKR
ncbi:NAD(P)/FAD-dependent oxidoreductase [Chakrabartyella piscis]|uniref:NAD(P)/FAD-dependent oxidoreductase n=1 Tax=Chakrabartyella piscis TaxID=2918914 RepID=UPI00295878D2|nr:FAD-dependent oxidoreductase [Chakrabartyella piscis]